MSKITRFQLSQMGHLGQKMSKYFKVEIRVKAYNYILQNPSVKYLKYMYIFEKFSKNNP